VLETPAAQAAQSSETNGAKQYDVDAVIDDVMSGSEPKYGPLLGRTPTDAQGIPSYTNSGYSGDGWPKDLNTNAMLKIAQVAQSYTGSLAWATRAVYGKYGSTVNKCTVFLNSVLIEEGAYSPRNADSCWLNPAKAYEWRNPSNSLWDWVVIPSPVPGAVGSDGGHVTIVSPSGTSVISVINGGYVGENDWGFRPKQAGTITWRGYIGR